MNDLFVPEIEKLPPTGHVAGRTEAGATSMRTLVRSYDRVAAGKSLCYDLFSFSVNKAEELRTLKEELRSREYQISPFRQRTIYDPKKRLITVPHIRDRIAQGAFSMTTTPILDRTLVDHTYACRKGKALLVALEDIRRALIKGKYHYMIKTDIRHYFDTIDHSIALHLWDHLLDEDWAHWFLEVNFDSFGEVGMHKGNVVSQDTGNLYLSPLDHLVMDELGYGAYFRNMDDILVMTETLREAEDLLQAMDDFVTDRLRLELSDKKTAIKEIHPSKGITFCKRVVYPDHFEISDARLRQTIRKVYKHREDLDALIRDWKSFDGELTHFRRSYLVNEAEKEMIKAMKITADYEEACTALRRAGITGEENLIIFINKLQYAPQDLTERERFALKLMIDALADWSETRTETL